MDATDNAEETLMAYRREELLQLAFPGFKRDHVVSAMLSTSHPIQTKAVAEVTSSASVTPQLQVQ